MGRKSIGNKLKTVRTYETQQKTLSEWAKNWHDDQVDVIRKLRYAATHDAHGDIMHMIQQLEGITEKRFTALNNVLRTLSDPDRKLERYASTDNKSKDNKEELFAITKSQEKDSQES